MLFDLEEEKKLLCGRVLEQILPTKRNRDSAEAVQSNMSLLRLARSMDRHLDAEAFAT